MIRVAVQAEDFDPGVEFGRLADAATGGIGSFIGVVRAGQGPHPVTAMTLEHYPDMTERALRDAAAQAATRWDLTGCTIIHRIGRLSPGQNIVLVAAAAAHRHAALAATAFLIEWLKTSAPFWKREEYLSQPPAWVEPCATALPAGNDAL